MKKIKLKKMGRSAKLQNKEQRLKCESITFKE